MKKITMRVLFIVTSLLVLSSFLAPARAAQRNLSVNVKVIKADRASNHIDPKIKDVVSELGPVLNFTGFSLLKESTCDFSHEPENRIGLPTCRTLTLLFKGFENEYVRLRVAILENNQEIFSTVLLLVDNGSVLIGGPPYENGVLLLRITGHFSGA
jgi:hypothetical protein